MVTNWATSFSHYKNRGFRRFLVLNYHFVLFLCPIICQFSKNSLFRKKGAKFGFFGFPCFKFIFWKFSFLGLLKHYNIMGFSRFLSFFVEGEEKGKKHDNWNFWIWVLFCPKMAGSWCITAFQKTLLKPLFLSCFLGALFLGQCVKKGNVGHPPKKGKKWLITEKFFWGIFVFFVLLFLDFLCLFAFFLGPKPSLFTIFCFFLFCFFLSFRCCLIQKNLVFPLEKGIFCLFLSVLFQFIFLCLSLVLLRFPSFLSFCFAFFGFLVFVSIFSFYFFFALVSWKEQHQTIQ